LTVGSSSFGGSGSGEVGRFGGRRPDWASEIGQALSSNRTQINMAAALRGVERLIGKIPGCMKQVPSSLALISTFCVAPVENDSSEPLVIDRFSLHRGLSLSSKLRRLQFDGHRLYGFCCVILEESRSQADVPRPVLFYSLRFVNGWCLALGLPWYWACYWCESSGIRHD
jgi:hypothetical protein